MRLSGLLSTLLLSLSTLARPSPRSNHVVHEKRAMEPRSWVKTRRLEADHILPMRFGMTQSNLHNLEDMLMAVSHPESPTYGRHYTPVEVVEAFAPTAFLVTVETDEEAIEEANSRIGGLSASVFTTSYERGLRMARELEFGQVQINNMTTFAERK